MGLHQATSHQPPSPSTITHSLTHTGRKRKRTRKKTGQDKGQGVVGWCGGWQDHHKASWLVTTSVLGPHPTLCPLPCLALPCLGLAWLGHTPFFLVAYPPFFPPFFPLHLHNGHCPIILQTNTLFYHSNFQIISFNSFSTTQHKDKETQRQKTRKRKTK